MNKLSKIVVRNDSNELKTLWIEPWGADYGMLPNDEFEIVEEEASYDFYFNLT